MMKSLKTLIRPVVPVGILDALDRRHYLAIQKREERREAVPSILAPVTDRPGISAIILYCRHPFGVMEAYASALRSAFSMLQIEVTLLDVEDQVVLDRMAAEATRFDIAVSIGSQPFSRQSGSKPIYEIFGDLFFMWALDSLITELSRVWQLRQYLRAAQRSMRLSFLVSDRDYARTLAEVISDRQVHFFPFAGFYDSGLPEKGRGERIARLAVVGTIGAEYPTVAHTTLAEVVRTYDPLGLTDQQRRSFCAAIEAPGAHTNIVEVARKELDLGSDILLSERLLPLLTQIDSYEKRRRRVLVIEGLRGLPVDFYGTGWSSYFAGSTSFREREPVPFTAMSRLTRHYAALVNFDSNWDDGVHDRVYTALGNGCRVITNANVALSGLDSPQGSVFAYDPNHPEVAGVAGTMLTMDPLRQEVLLAFRRRHSWLGRVETLFASVAGPVGKAGRST